MQIKHKVHMVALTVCGAAVLALAGCGGGGGDDHTNVVPPGNSTDGSTSTGGSTDSSGNTSTSTPGTAGSIEGVWFGSGANGSRAQSIRMTVLDDGSLWGVTVSGSDSTGTNFQNMFHGSASASGNSVSGSFTQFNSLNTSPQPGSSFSGSVVDPTDLNLAFSNGLSVPVASNADYASTASLSSLATSYAGQFGTWGNNSYQQSHPTLTVSGSTLSLSANSSGCSASGTIAPHMAAQGTVGVFDLSLTFSGASCVLGDGTTVNGIAYPFGDAQTLEAIAVTPDGQYGILFEGNPQ